MPRVPTLAPRVQYRTPNVPAPVPAPTPPEEAFGGGRAAAAGNIGKAVENLGTVLSKHVVLMAQRESQKNALDIQNKYQAEIQNTINDTTPDENGIPKGYLNRALSQANGATVEFDKIAAQIAKKYAAMPVSPELRNNMDETLRSHMAAAREKVISHEADQRRLAVAETLKTFETQNVDAAAGVGDPADLKPLIKSAQVNAITTLRRQGHDALTIDLKSKELAGKMIASSVSSILESNPVRAAEVLDAMKGEMLPSDYLTIKKTVDVKIIHERQVQTWGVVSGMTNSDGMIDLGRAEKYVYSLPVTAEDKQQIFSFVHQMASVNDNIVKERRAANDKAFASTLVQDWKNGVPVMDGLQKAANVGRDPADILAKQKEVIELYSGQTNPFDKWLEHQDSGQKLAWEEVKSMIEHQIPEKKKITLAGYPEPIGMRDAFMVEMKRAALGKSPEEIMDIAKKKLENVDMGWWHFDKARWQIDAESRAANSDAMLRVKTLYGDNLVKQATAFLQGRQSPVTPANIEVAIKAATEARKKK